MVELTNIFFSVFFNKIGEPFNCSLLSLSFMREIYKRGVVNAGNVKKQIMEVLVLFEERFNILAI